jgi:hypothetical protein
MKTRFLLPLFLCFSLSGLFAQSTIIVKDTAGVEHRIQYEKTKVTILFNDFSRVPMKGKLVSYENGNFYMQNGAVLNKELVYEINLDGGKDKTARPLAIYYFCSVNASAGIMFAVAGNGLGTLLVDALVIAATPITMLLVPKIISRNARINNPIIIPMKGNFK